jgi:hypothetical protein
MARPKGSKNKSKTKVTKKTKEKSIIGGYLLLSKSQRNLIEKAIKMLEKMLS